MFSFGFQKAFQRGFEPDDEVFFTRVRILLGHTEINANRCFKEPGKCQDRRYDTHRHFGSDGLHSLCARRCVKHVLLYSRSQRRIHI